MPENQHADLVGVELASEALLGDRPQVLLAFLVRGEDGGDALELGAWTVTGDGKLVRPARQPLVFPVGEVDAVRALAERAAAALPHAAPGRTRAPSWGAPARSRRPSHAGRTGAAGWPRCRRPRSGAWSGSSPRPSASSPSWGWWRSQGIRGLDQAREPVGAR